MDWLSVFGVGSDQLLDRLDLTAGMRVLDVGCGDGRVSIPAARRVAPGGLVVALDVREHQLRKLEARAAKYGLTHIRILQGAIETADLEPETFDRALLAGVLGEVSDGAAALRRIFAALKPGGMLSVTEAIIDPHRQRYTSVLERAEQAGFRPGQSYRTWAAYTVNLVRPHSTSQ